jgi:hypothetical protein
MSTKASHLERSTSVVVQNLGAVARSAAAYLQCLFVAALMTSFAIPGLSAQAASGVGNAIVQGHVESADHNHAVHAQILMTNRFDKKSLTAATDPDGNFRFSRVEPGAYDVAVEYNGSTSFRRSIMVNSGRYSGLTLSIGLGSLREAGEGKGKAGAAISAESFSVHQMRPEAVEAQRALSQKAVAGQDGVQAEAAAQTAGTNSPASFQIYSYVQNHNPPHVGFNYSDNHSESENEWLTNGGAEPWEARVSLPATQDGTSTTFVAQALNGTGGTDLSASITSGFFNGGIANVYRYTNGAWTLLRSDTIQNYTAVTGSTNPADFTITFAESGPATEKGDIVWVELNDQLGQIPGNDYFDRGPAVNDPGGPPQFPTLCLDWQVVAGGENGCWQLYNNNPAPYNIVADAPTPTSEQVAAGEGYTDSTSLEVVDSNTEVQGIQDYIGYNYCNEDSSGNFYESYTPGDTYQLGVWLKGNSTDGVVTLNYTDFNISHQFTGLSNTWQYYTYQFPAPPCVPNGEPVVTFSLKYNAPGTLEVNGLHVYDTSYPPFQIVPQVLTAFKNYEPGVIRFWSNQSNSAGNYEFWSLDSWLLPEWQNHSAPLLGNYYSTDEISEHLPDALALASSVGTTPWFIVNMSLSAEEWSNLYDYLAAPAGVGYASKRPANHPGPYTSDFNKIYLEIGNEQRGTIATAANVEYGAWVNYVTSMATAGKNYANGNNIQFIGNAFTLQPLFGSGVAKTAPLVKTLDIANYTPASNGELPSAGATYYQSELLAVPQKNKGQIDGVVAQQQIDALSGFNYQLNIYEEGAGTDNPNISYGDPSLAAATASLDASLYATSQGIQDQGFFLYGLGTGAYTSHNFFAQGFIPHPIWEAFQARNQYLNGDAVLTVPTAVPSYSDGSPLIGAYGFHDAGDQVDVAVVSRDFYNTTPVTLNFPATPTGTATLYSLTPPQGGDPTATNDTGLNIPLNSQTLSGVTQSYTFNMPPGSIYIFQVPTTGGWSNSVPLPAAPSVLQANADNGKVSLAWTPSATATSYNLQRSTQTGGPYTSIATLAGNSYVDTAVANGTTYFYVVAATNSAGSSGNSQEVSATPNVVQIGYTSTPPPLDGSSGGAWANAPEVSITNYFDINSDVENDQGEFKALWDNNNLYLLVTVKDNTLTTSADVFDGDAVEVYFSATDSKALAYGATEFQYGFPYGSSTVTEAKHGATTGVAFGQENTANGYQFGISIPWSTLGVSSPTAGAQYGFDVQVDDAQVANTLFGKFAWWATQNLSYQYPYLFGPAVLAYGSTLPAGTLISIPNYSFEGDTVPSTGADYNTPSDWTFAQTNTGGESGISQINSATNGGFILGQDGSNYWVPSDFNNSSTPYGTSTDTLTTSAPVGTFAANTTYTLTVALADPADGTPSSEKEIGFQLLANGTPVAESLSNDIEQGAAFQDKTLTFDTASNSSVVGQQITIQLVYTYYGAYNRSAYFDNVRLTASQDSGGGTPPSAVNTTTLLSISPNTLTLTEGESYTLTATVTPANGSTTPSGNVVFTIGSSTQSVALNSSGVASYNGTAPSSTGTLSLSAQYQGTSAFNGSSSSTLSETITAPSGGSTGSIAIPNYSFEQGGVGYNVPSNWTFTSSGTTGNNYAVQYISNSTTPPAEDGSDYWAPGDFNPSTQPYGTSTTTLTTSASVGSFAANTTYTLTVALADPADGADPSEKSIGFQLLANGAPVATFASTSIPYGGNFADYSLTFDTSSNTSTVGQPITISLVYSYSGQYNRSAFFDNVRLTTAADSGSGGGGSSSPSQINLSGVANAIGITDDDIGFSGGGVDNDGNAYSANLLGLSLTDSAGTVFNFGTADQLDVVNGSSAPVIPLTSGKYSTLKLLGLAVNGGQSGTFTVTYSDSSTDQFPLSLDDWFTNPNNLVTDERVAATYPYRDNNQGAQNGGPLNLYEYSLGINNGKTVKSLTVPDNQNIVVVAATLLP